MTQRHTFVLKVFYFCVPSFLFLVLRLFNVGSERKKFELFEKSRGITSITSHLRLCRQYLSLLCFKTLNYLKKRNLMQQCFCRVARVADSVRDLHKS